MKILLITSMPWREDNNIGNSYSNLFVDIDEFEIAHIYCREGVPFNSKVNKYFQITEKRLAKSILRRSFKTGIAFEMDASQNEKDSSTKSMAMNKAKLLRWEILFVLRDLIWMLGKWRTRELYKFVDEFKPDLIFGTLTYMSNVNRMMIDLKQRLNIPLVLYSWDDVYSWNHFSWNPLFIIRKLYNRHYIRMCVAISSVLYTITKEMQVEYGAYFKKECKLLYKSYDFPDTPLIKEVSQPVRLLFMGNIGAGRWKTLAKIVDVLKLINIKDTKAVLDIYTLSPLSHQMIKRLNVDEISTLHEPIAQDKIMETQRNADILIHVEPISRKEASFYRLSFSTKLVDYMYNARCILGLGSMTATLSYIRDNKFGIVVTDIEKSKDIIEKLISSPQTITEYGKRAWMCGKENHKRENIRNMLIADLNALFNRNL